MNEPKIPRSERAAELDAIFRSNPDELVRIYMRVNSRMTGQFLAPPPGTHTSEVPGMILTLEYGE